MESIGEHIRADLLQQAPVAEPASLGMLHQHYELKYGTQVSLKSFEVSLYEQVPREELGCEAPSTSACHAKVSKKQKIIPKIPKERLALRNNESGDSEGDGDSDREVVSQGSTLLATSRISFGGLDLVEESHQNPIRWCPLHPVSGPAEHPHDPVPCHSLARVIQVLWDFRLPSPPALAGPTLLACRS